VRLRARLFARYDGEHIPPGRVAVFTVLVVAALIAVVAMVMSEAATAGAALQP
jgi:hypothetical protein